MKRRTRVILSTVGGVIAAVVIAAGWIWHSRAPVLKEVAQDLRAGAMSRHAANPFEKFLELRYGSMENPTNRQNAFRGFFDPVHNEGMHRLVGFMKPNERQANINATAEWIAKYRQNMSSEEKESLAQWLQSPEGRTNIQRSSSLFRSRDLKYRSTTEPVIRELMTTLADLHQSPAQ